MLTILFDGIAYGMLLFVVAMRACSVTLGLMNFVNLAQRRLSRWRCGYITVVLVNRIGIPFLSARCRSPSLFTALIGVALERHALRSSLQQRRISNRCCSRIGLRIMSGRAAGRLRDGLAPAAVRLDPVTTCTGQINLLSALASAAYRLSSSS